MTIPEKIKANAEIVIETLGPVSELPQFGFTRESVDWVEGFIERQRVREDMTDEEKDRLVNMIGSYLGECIIRTYGGEWCEAQDTWGVRVNEKLTAFPFAKVQKQYDNGIEGGDSILSFFDGVGPLMKHNETKTRPWWKFW